MADTPTGGDDVIFGNDRNNIINALGGNDVVSGGSGNDILSGSTGNDQLSGGNGLDILNGGSGNDTGFYLLAAGDVFASLNLGYGYVRQDGLLTDKDSFFSIENITGGNGADELEGSSGANTLIGGGGNDEIDGLGGADTIDGGSGNDRLQGGTGNDDLDAGFGEDTIEGGPGADTHDGGDGEDLLQYDFSSAGVTIDLATGLASGGYAEGDANSSIENVTGSGFDDVLRGNGLGNAFTGNGGHDTLTGRGGDDRLTGNAGNDTLNGGSGFDQLNGGLGQDTMSSGSGVDFFAYASTGDSVPFMPEADVITDFTSGEDKISVFRIDANTATLIDDDFTFIGTAQYTSGVAGQIRVTFTGGDTVVSFRTDTSGTDMFIVLEGTHILSAVTSFSD